MDEFYFDQLSRGRFQIPQCNNCQRFHFYPRVSCPFCHSFALRWVDASGRGVVYSTTVVRKNNGADHNVALIDLAEGPRMMSRVTGIDPSDVRIGLSVEAEIEQDGDRSIVVFRPEVARA
ncbi:Zn-ribbon domain-containing OB-fold protein [Rhodococcus koreensis]|uniref:Zn-ribbon domain-containing OB-fold protein n=1 Tax=Rhodococcus koreensis TaxID=99653 RepID=UPI0036DCB21E